MDSLTIKDKSGNEASLYVALASEAQCILAPARLNIRDKDKDYAVPAIKTVGTDVEICSSSSGATPIFTYYGTSTSPTLHFLKNNTEYYCVKNVKWRVTNYFSYVPNGGEGSTVKKLILGNINGNDAPVNDNAKFLTAAEAGFTRKYYNFVGWLYNNDTDRSFGAPIFNRDLSGTADPVMYAKWVEYYYTLSFNANGGQGSMSSIQLNYSQPHTLTNKFTRTGYSFTRWALNSTSGTAYNDEAVVSKLTTTDKGSVTLYAIWTPITYNISYDLASGKWNGDAGKATYSIESATYTPPSPVRTGYDFLGWSPESIPQGSIGDKNLTANWKTHEYSITYDQKGGSGGSGPSKYKITDNAVAPTANPTKTGYTFGGWTPSNIPAGSWGDKTFTATWNAISYKITYDQNGGTGGSGPATYTVETGATPTANPTRTGYTFKGWSPASIAKGETGDKTFTAVWALTNYSITYSLSGGSISEQQKTYNIESSSYTPPDPSRTGYKFTGWTPKMIAKGSTGDKTFTASWDPITYYINYNANGGTGSIASLTCKYDQTYTLSSSRFSRANWVQDGWNDSKHGHGYGFGASVKNLESKNGERTTMYAVWHKAYLLPSIVSAKCVNISYGSWSSWSSWSGWSNGSWGSRSHSRTRSWTATVRVTVKGGTSDVETVLSTIKIPDYNISTSVNATLWGGEKTNDIVIASGSSDVSYVTVNVYRDSTLAASTAVYIGADGYDVERDYKDAPSSSSSSG